MADFNCDRLAPWMARLTARPLPVLAATREALECWRERPDQADANALADVALADPLMALALLVEVAQRLGPRLSRPVETVTAGLVLLGIEPFFRAFSELETLEARLAAQPQALAAADALVRRAHHAARLAAAFAVHRQDEDAETLHQAALLSHATGLLLWAQAPAEALAIAAREAAAPGADPADAQRAVLGVTLELLERSLLAHWHLPPALAEMLQPGLTAPPGPRCVALAVRLARHLQRGRDHPALGDDFAALGQLLNVPAASARALVLSVEQED